MSLESGLESVVSIEYDANADGSTTDAEGFASQGWVALAGYSAVPCRICDDESQKSKAEFSEDLTTTTMLFATYPVLPNNLKLRFAYQDVFSGELCYYYADGKITRVPKNTPRYQRVRARLGAIA